MNDRMFEALKQDAFGITRKAREQEKRYEDAPWYFRDILSSLKCISGVRPSSRGDTNTVVRTLRNSINAMIEDLGSDMRLPKIEDSPDGYPIGSVVVPLANPNCHSYQEGKPVLIVQPQIGMGINTEVGNLLPDPEQGAVRYATDEEIESFFEALSEHKNRLNVFRI